jgi:hypothetical protein
MKMFKEAWFWIIAISIVISLGIIFLSDGISIFTDRETVIVVNEEKMNRKEFSGVLKQAEQNYSQIVETDEGEISDEEIKEAAIDMATEQLLFVSYAKKLNISVTEKEIENFYEEVISREEDIENKEQLFAEWENEGFDRFEMERQVRVYLLYDKIYEKYAQETTITEEDLEDAYNDYVSWMEEVGAPEDDGIMPYEEIKGELEDFIVQEKTLENLEKDIEEFRNESIIEILI